MMYLKQILIRFILLVICWFTSMIAALGALVNLLFNPDASWRSLKAYDQLVNSTIPYLLSIMFGVKTGDPTFGHEDETVSSVLGKLYEEGRGNSFARKVRDVLEEIDPGHCDSAIERAINFRAE